MKIPSDPNDWRNYLQNLTREELERELCKDWYKLDDQKNVVPVESWLDRATWNADRTKGRVGDTYYNYAHNGRAEYVRVASDFLGMDQRWGRRGPPIVFETMIFDFPVENCRCWQCCTWEESERQHTFACLQVEAWLNANGYPFTSTVNEPEEYSERNAAKWRESMENLKRLHKDLEKGEPLPNPEEEEPDDAK